MLIGDNCKYLIDSNCFITAKNSYYNPVFCSQFWNVIRQLHEKKVLYSIDKVKKELSNAEENDYAKIHIAEDKFFENMWLETSFTSSGYKKVVDEAGIWHSKNPSGRNKAFENFLQGNAADAFLLATAYEYKYAIVTNEVLDEKRNNNIKIPNIANKLGIECCNIYTLLQRHCTANFSLKV